MNFVGIIIGAAAFIIIGLFHPLVIKGEYYFSKKIWPVFFVVGIAFSVGSLFIGNAIISPLMGVTGFSCFWSIKELYEQEERVRKGWFKQNPKRKEKDKPDITEQDINE